ncbi:MAG TPA: MucB/RseB C-terminal domain-containing protein [Methylophilaceae bacterium]|nr:MucB/RseB C-terminal domain-containing protein [Methylophilaceae bacterium]
MLVLMLAAPLSALAGEAADDPWQTLEKASHAARDLSYKGVFVYQSGDSSRSVQITHMNYGQGEYARIVMLDGLPREVLSQGSDVVIFNPHDEKVVIEKRRGHNMFPALLPPHISALKTIYQARLGNNERIGGHMGQVIFLEPRDKYRYGYEFWVDRENGLLLKYVTVNENNEVMEKIAFNQVALLDTHEMDWFQPNVDHAKAYVMEDHAPSRVLAEVEGLSLGDLPPGYRKVDQMLTQLQGKAKPITHLIFSDGLASVSLFIEPLAKDAPPKNGHNAMGATHFYACVVDGRQITVVGEVPEATVAQIAHAIRFNN